MSEHLAQEERVARGLFHQPLRELRTGLPQLVVRGPFEELVHLAAIDPAEVDPLDIVIATEIAEQRTERMGAIDVGVAVGAHDQE